MPDAPKEEAAFLSFPKAGEQVLHRQRFGGMLPGVIILKQVAGDDIVQREEYARYGYPVYRKTVAPHQLPGVATVAVAQFGLCRAEVAEGAEEGGYKRKDCKKMTQLPGSKLFANVLNIQCLSICVLVVAN